MMDAAALLIQHQKRKLVLTVENVMSSTSSDLSLRDCMWDVSYLMGCVMHPSLLQDLSGKSGPGPCCPQEGWDISCGLSVLFLVFFSS